MLAEAIFCMALNIYHEARSETQKGQAAVAYTVLNRAQYRPEKICDVILDHEQFSWTNRLYKAPKADRDMIYDQLRPTDMPAWYEAKRVAQLAIIGKIPNPIGKADHYFNPKKANPVWAKEMVHVADIGGHRFLFGGRFKEPT